MIDTKSIPRAKSDGTTAWADRHATGGPVTMRLEGESGGPRSVEVLFAQRPDWFVCPDTPEVRAMGLVPGKRRVRERVVRPCPSVPDRPAHDALLDVAEGDDGLGCFECPTCGVFYVVKLEAVIPTVTTPTKEVRCRRSP